MDRRGFFKTIFFTSLFSPVFLSSKSAKKNLQLYLIADSPQMFLSIILRELQKHGLIYGPNFNFLNFHPEEKALKKVLAQKGWRSVSEASPADLSLSFSPLSQKTLPSFALIKGGSVCDIRSRKLSALWHEMNSSSPSSILTIVSFKEKNPALFPGSFASIYIDGHKADRVSLKKNLFKSFRTKRGNIAVVVQNGKAWVAESSCPRKICLFTPPVSLAGERIICAPNHFLIEAQSSHSIDTVIG